ncbi:hypothetical protein [Desulfovibrio litoralis]|uniref:Uncharacterized protein n=1 Tax=Desulfovibrio litoralis DSM 11393 TaxID=1121455 RepID=A0A1M7TCW6_9BACT|nr:hypothetical protein [Desulfovibrio litoralis]SHN68562.1 hypothetical protein SAMN02745728_01852 [Desulfovibrio litoralis DSM 11393]
MAIESLPLIVQQVGYVENIAQAQEHSPAVQQALNHQAALDFLQHQKQQVEGSEESDAGKKVKDKQQNKNKHARKKQMAQQVVTHNENDELSENIPETDERNPWAGNIINRKI